jgi:hypothetical protein
MDYTHMQLGAIEALIVRLEFAGAEPPLPAALEPDR